MTIALQSPSRSTSQIAPDGADESPGAIARGAERRCVSESMRHIDALSDALSDALADAPDDAPCSSSAIACACNCSKGQDDRTARCGRFASQTIVHRLPLVDRCTPATAHRMLLASHVSSTLRARLLPTDYGLRSPVTTKTAGVGAGTLAARHWRPGRMVATPRFELGTPTL